MVTKCDIVNLLKEFNIKSDDVVTMHCSLKAIGEIENGADGLIDAIKDYLCDGIFFVPTHTWANVTKENPFYDVSTTEPCIGVLPKIAAKRKDSVRSLHPTHSVAAFGKDAREFVAGEEKSTSPAPVGSPLSRLYENNGKILLIGVGQERNTYIHAVDEMLDIPKRLSDTPFGVTIKDENGRLYKLSGFRPHSRDWSCCFPNFDEAFRHHGVVSFSKLGGANVCCCDAKKLTDVLKKIWSRADHDVCEKIEIIPKEYYI